MTLSLPLATARPDPAARAAPVATTLTGARVLVVENDASTAEALQRLLRNWDAQVEAHRDLADVVGAVRAGMQRPDVMIVDYHLDHGEVGLEVVEHLRREEGWMSPVIVTTADYGADLEQRALVAGAELVHKPIKPAQLRSLLAYLLT